LKTFWTKFANTVQAKCWPMYYKAPEFSPCLLVKSCCCCEPCWI